MGSIWTLKDAQESLAVVVEAADNGEPQRVRTARGRAVVIVSEDEFDTMSQRPKTFVEHLLSAPKLPEGYDDIFDRDDYPPAKAREFDLE